MEYDRYMYFNKFCMLSFVFFYLLRVIFDCVILLRKIMDCYFWLVDDILLNKIILVCFFNVIFL